MVVLCLFSLPLVTKFQKFSENEINASALIIWEGSCGPIISDVIASDSPLITRNCMSCRCINRDNQPELRNRILFQYMRSLTLIQAE